MFWLFCVVDNVVVYMGIRQQYMACVDKCSVQQVTKSV